MQIRKERYDELVKAEIALEKIKDVIESNEIDNWPRIKLAVIVWLLEVYYGKN